MGIMYILMILFEGISDYIITFSSVVILAIVFNISLAVFVFNNAKTRQLDNETLWAVLTGFFGFPITLLFLLMNINLGEKNDDAANKKLQKKALIICAAAIALSSICYPVYNYEDRKTTLNNQYEDSIHMPYLNEDKSQYLFYDKMGKVYHFFDEKDIPFYTPEKTKLKYEDYSDEIPENEYEYDKEYTQYISDDRNTVIDSANALINQDGFIVEMDTRILKCYEIENDDSKFYERDSYEDYKKVYSDIDGNLFFEPDDCSWDINGNLVFRNKNLTEYVNKHK